MGFLFGFLFGFFNRMTNKGNSYHKLQIDTFKLGSDKQFKKWQKTEDGLLQKLLLILSSHFQSLFRIVMSCIQAALWTNSPTDEPKYLKATQQTTTAVSL